MSKEAEVRCAGISYAVKNPLLDPDGEQVRNDAGVPQFSIERKEARMGEIVTLSDHEFKVHEEQGGVQEPGSAPLPGSPGFRPGPTPFSTPVVLDDSGTPVTWPHPVMGDPAPAGAGLSDVELAKAGGALTTERIAELEAMASGEGDVKEVTEIDAEEASVDEIREFITDNKLNAEDTVDLAYEDPDVAQKVLDAERAGKDRVTVTERLEKIISDAEDDG